MIYCIFKSLQVTAITVIPTVISTLPLTYSNSSHMHIYDVYITQYLGHILRMDPARMVHKAVQYMHENRVQGDLLMDAPSYSWPELVELQL